MMFTGCYFKPETHHGAVMRTSIGSPDGIRIDGSLDFLYPTPKLVHRWKSSAQTETDWVAYRSGYWAILAERREPLMGWIESLDAVVDQTLCCYEATDTHCHRRFVGLLIQKYRPECWGGESVVKEVPPEPAIVKPAKTKKAVGVGVWEVGAYVKHHSPASVPGTQDWRGKIVAIITPTVFEIDWFDQKDDLKMPKIGHRDHVFQKQIERYPQSVLYLIDKNGNPYA